MCAETALLVIDMQKGFLHPDGENFYAAAQETIAPTEQLIVESRKNNRLIVHVADQHRPGLNDFESHKLPTHCLSTDWNSDFFDGFGPQDRDREIAVHKRRFSAFFATDLALLLQEQKIERLVIAGIKTNVCVRSTIQDAFAHGFKTLLARETTNSNRSHLADAALEDIERYFGWVVSQDDAIEALS